MNIRGFAVVAALLTVLVAGCAASGGAAQSTGSSGASGVPNTPACHAVSLSTWEGILGGKGHFASSTVVRLSRDTCYYQSGSVNAGTGNVASLEIACGQAAAAIASQSTGGPLTEGGAPFIANGGQGGAEAYLSDGVYVAVSGPGLTTPVAQVVFKEALGVKAC